MGYSAAIGTHKSKMNIEVSDTVAFHSFMAMFRADSGGNRFERNLGVLMEENNPYPFDKFALQFPATYEIVGGNIVHGNVAHGSDRLGYILAGDKCSTILNNPGGAEIKDNEAAGMALIGIEIMGAGSCTALYKFNAFSCWDYGIHVDISASFELHNSVVADSTSNLVLNTYGTDGVHVTVNNSFVAGKVQGEEVCENSPLHPTTTTSYPLGAHIAGMLMSSHTRGQGLVFSGKKPWHDKGSYQKNKGITRIENTGFDSFGFACRKNSAVFNGQGTPDGQHTHRFKGSKWGSAISGEAAKVLLSDPSPGWRNPTDCVDLDCDGPSHALIVDEDGTFTGTNVKHSSVLPAGANINPYAGNSNSAKGSGVVRGKKPNWEFVGGHEKGIESIIPMAMMTTPQGTRWTTSADYIRELGRGIPRDSCEWIKGWNAWKCSGNKHEQITFQSLDADTETRRCGPVFLVTPRYKPDGNNGLANQNEIRYGDMLNGPMDHGWCQGYTCLKRLSTFLGIVETGREYDVAFTGTPPTNMKIHPIEWDVDHSVLLSIYNPNPQRIDIYKKGIYIAPNNANAGRDNFYNKKYVFSRDDEYTPKLDGSEFGGMNYFSWDWQTLHLVIKGPTLPCAVGPTKAAHRGTEMVRV